MARKRRRRRSEAAELREKRWRRILSEQRASGLNHSNFCKRRSISRYSYFWWKREIPLRDQKRRTEKRSPKKREAKEGTRQALVPVHISRQADVRWAFEVVLSENRRVRMLGDFDADDLRRLVVALEEIQAC